MSIMSCHYNKMMLLPFCKYFAVPQYNDNNNNLTTYINRPMIGTYQV